MSIATFEDKIIWESFVVERCYKCGMLFAMTNGHERYLRGDHKTPPTFYCPSGHGQVYKESAAAELRRERDLLRQQIAQRDDEIAEQKQLRTTAEIARNAAEHKAILAKKKVVKLKARAAAGVCPCCNRTFIALQRHMDQKHPQFKAEGA
jgi:hypothetical protein